MKKFILPILFSCSFVYAQIAPTQVAVGFSLPPYTYTDGRIRYVDMPEFSLPPQFQVMNNGGPLRGLEIPANPAVDNYIYTQILEQLKRGWTHSDLGILATVPDGYYNNSNFPESKRVCSIYGDVLDTFPIQQGSPWNNNLNQIESNIINRTGGHNAKYGNPSPGLFDADVVWIDLETYQYYAPQEINGLPAECSNLYNWRGQCGNTWQFGNDYYWAMYNFHTDLMHRLRSHMKPGAKLFMYGPDANIDAAPNYHYYEISSGINYTTSAMRAPSNNGVPSYWKLGGMGSTLGGQYFNEVNYACESPYPSCDNCFDLGNDYNNYCDTVTFRTREWIQHILMPVEIHLDNMKLRPASERKDLMLMTSLYYFPTSGRMGGNPIKTLAKNDAEGLAIFPFMMGCKNVGTWIDPMTRQDSQSCWDDKASTGISLSHIQNKMRGGLRAYEDYTNGLYKFSQFGDMFDGNEEYVEPQHVPSYASTTTQPTYPVHTWDWAVHNSRAYNNEFGLTPANIWPYLRIVRNGCEILVAAQNIFAPDNPAHITNFPITYTDGSYTFSTTIQLSGRSVYLARFRTDDRPGCELASETITGLKSFDVNSLNRSSSLLSWTMNPSSTITNFDIQRSADAYTFGQIGTQKSLHIDQYTFEDTEPLEGKNYYRLAAHTSNGEIQYSEIKEINFHSIPKVEVYPNPAKSTLHIKTLGSLEPIKIAFYNLEGKEVLGRNWLPEEAKVLDIDISNLSAGMYHYTLQNEFGTSTGKIVVE